MTSIWDFSKSELKISTCLLCNKSFSRKLSTIKRHFRAKHSEEFIKLYPNEQKISSLVEFAPNELNQNERDHRMDVCTNLLTLQENFKWLDYLITSSEKSIFLSRQHRKIQFVNESDVALQDLSARKVILCIWFTINGPLYWEIIAEGFSVSDEAHVRQLQDLKSKVDISLLKDHRVYYQRDSVRPHITKVVQNELKSYNWTVIPFVAKSIDLHPYDYWIFSDIYRFLEGKDFDSCQEITNVIAQYLKSRSSEFWWEGIQKLPVRWQRILDNDGGYY